MAAAAVARSFRVPDCGVRWDGARQWQRVLVSSYHWWASRGVPLTILIIARLYYLCHRLQFPASVMMLLYWWISISHNSIHSYDKTHFKIFSHAWIHKKEKQETWIPFYQADRNRKPMLAHWGIIVLFAWCELHQVIHYHIAIRGVWYRGLTRNVRFSVYFLLVLLSNLWSVLTWHNWGIASVGVASTVARPYYW